MCQSSLDPGNMSTLTPAFRVCGMRPSKLSIHNVHQRGLKQRQRRWLGFEYEGGITSPFVRFAIMSSSRHHKMALPKHLQSLRWQRSVHRNYPWKLLTVLRARPDS